METRISRDELVDIVQFLFGITDKEKAEKLMIELEGRGYEIIQTKVNLEQYHEGLL